MQMKLIIKAFTQSEWDPCDVAIIDIDVQKCIDFINLVRRLKEEGNDVAYLTYWFSASAEFKNWSDDNDLLGDDNIKEYTEDMEFDDIETHFDSPDLIVYENSITISCSGKHTGEEFWTEHISYEKLLELNQVNA